MEVFLYINAIFIQIYYMKVFTENQRMADSNFNKIVLVLVIILFSRILYGAIRDGFNGTSIFTLTVLSFAIVVFIVFQLRTKIDAESILIRITPFNLYRQNIKWNEIKKYKVVEYSAIKEYGGWGYRRNKKGVAFNPSGNKGFKIYFKDGNELLIGTRKPEELKQFLKSINK